jgi:hypothetical protein
MSTQPINDGGTAFPQALVYGSTGMSLRDWFAGLALQGILAHGSSVGGTPEQWASAASLIADAMIEARKKDYIIDRGEDK